MKADTPHHLPNTPTKKRRPSHENPPAPEKDTEGRNASSSGADVVAVAKGKGHTLDGIMTNIWLFLFSLWLTTRLLRFHYRNVLNDWNVADVPQLWWLVRAQRLVCYSVSLWVDTVDPVIVSSAPWARLEIVVDALVALSFSAAVLIGLRKSILQPIVAVALHGAALRVAEGLLSDKYATSDSEVFYGVNIPMILLLLLLVTRHVNAETDGESASRKKKKKSGGLFGRLSRFFTLSGLCFVVLCGIQGFFLQTWFLRHLESLRAIWTGEAA